LAADQADIDGVCLSICQQSAKGQPNSTKKDSREHISQEMCAKAIRLNPTKATSDIALKMDTRRQCRALRAGSTKRTISRTLAKISFGKYSQILLA
jgi:hypothetical protein